MIDNEGTKTTIATLYSKLLIKGYENGWLRKPSLSYCGYGNIFMTNKAQFKNEYEKYSTGEVPKLAEGTPLERVQVVNSGARVQIPPSPLAQKNIKKIKKVVDKHLNT